MISPGCSFTFDGLKQTLCAAGCDYSELRQVEHLLINYRTTKDILMLGNEILTVARKFFPGAIDFAKPERAIKDLGLKVGTFSWEEAFKSRVKFGENQAFIYSSSSNCEVGLLEEAGEWLDNHPFILSSLDSKGLEFDDVVVAFGYDDRKVWQIERKLEASLSMLRELYVAVTRAQRRVVVLVKEDVPAMVDFFDNLSCSLQKVDESIWHEFDCNTSAEDWYEKAQCLLQNDQFELAANCFTRAERQDWSFFARGRHFLELGLKAKAADEFRRAVRVFYERRNFQQVLVLLQRLLYIVSDAWDPTDDNIFTTALENLPKYLPRKEVVKFSILREDFSAVLVGDLSDPSVNEVLVTYRHADWLKKLVAGASDTDQDSIAVAMPLVVFDYHFERKHFHEACMVAVSARLIDLMDKTTTEFLKVMKTEWNPDSIQSYYDIVKNISNLKLSSPAASPSVLFSQLFESPQQVQRDLRTKCVDWFEKDIVMLAVDRSGLDRTILLDFSKDIFKAEVEQVLVARCRPYAVDVVLWYDSHGYQTLASEFAKDRIHLWSNDDLFRITIHILSRPTWLLQELQRRQMLDVILVLIVLSPFVGEVSKNKFVKTYLSFLNKKQEVSLDMMIDKCQQDFPKVMARMTTQWLHLEKVFLQMYMNCDMESLLRCSLEAIEAHELAAQNITGLFRLWKEGKQMGQVVMPIVKTQTYEEKCSFMMCLFFGQEPTDTNRHFHLDHQDPFMFLLLTFGPITAAYCKIHISDETESQNDVLLQRLAAFHHQLRARLSILKPNMKKPPSKSAIANAKTSNDQQGEEEGQRGEGGQTVLSKKALRKQKQQSKKKQQKQIEQQSNVKKKKSRRKNNKKKKME